MAPISRVFALWISILCFGLPAPTEGFLNVFLDQHEMVKLMGLDAELFYVRHGTVNNFALQFVVPVPETVDALTFSWQSLVDLPIRYSISIEYESPLGGLLTPHIDVPVQGLVPLEPSTFTLRLPCTGNVSEEIPVGIHLEIDATPHFNRTRLTFKRNKVCLLDEAVLERNLQQESLVFKGLVFAVTFLLVAALVLVTCYCRGSLSSSRHALDKSAVSAQTSYESSACSVSSRGTLSTMAQSTVSRARHLPAYSLEYETVGGFQRPQSMAASCSSLYETIAESGHRFPLQTMHSNKTCGACCSVFGDGKTLYDGVTIAGLVLPPPLPPMMSSRTTIQPQSAGVYEMPQEQATIRWPAPPLYQIEDEQKQNPKHGFQSNTVSSSDSVKEKTVKQDTNTIRSNATPAGGSGDRNPFRSGLWTTAAEEKEACNYYEPTDFGNQHL